MDSVRMGLLLLVFKVLPWVLVTVGSVAAISWSPLGRGLLRFLRDREGEARLTRQLVDELSTLRVELGEALERLDSTERRLAQHTSGSESRPGIGSLPELSSPDRIITPH